jgi:hypothetical protein
VEFAAPIGAWHEVPARRDCRRFCALGSGLGFCGLGFGTAIITLRVLLCDLLGQPNSDVL